MSTLIVRMNDKYQLQTLMFMLAYRIGHRCRYGCKPWRYHPLPHNCHP